MIRNTKGKEAMLRTLKKRPGVWLLFLCIFSSCIRIPVDYSQFENFTSSGIQEDWAGEFTPYPVDSTSAGHTLYDVVLTVRYSNRCNSSNIIFDVEEISLSDQTPDSTRVEMNLFNLKGQPLGTGNLGLYELSDTLHRGVKIEEGYSVSVKCPLPQEETSGINAVGISLVKSGEPTTFSLRNLPL